jgi:hypothetical protein
VAYDSRCYELAEIFLSDEPEEYQNKVKRRALAQYIQDAIEEWFEARKDEGGGK